MPTTAHLTAGPAASGLRVGLTVWFYDPSPQDAPGGRSPWQLRTITGETRRNWHTKPGGRFPKASTRYLTTLADVWAAICGHAPPQRPAALLLTAGNA